MRALLLAHRGAKAGPSNSEKARAAAAILIQRLARGKKARRTTFLMRADVAENREELLSSLDNESLKDRPESRFGKTRDRSRAKVSSEEMAAVKERMRQRAEERRQLVERGEAALVQLLGSKAVRAKEKEKELYA